MRRRSGLREGILAACVLLALSGCHQGQGPAQPPGSEPTEGVGPDLEELHAQSLDLAWERVVAVFPEAQRPRVDTVRFIDLEEWAQIQSECLQGLGFPVEPLPDGGMSFESVALDQQEALHLAVYECEAQYPVDPRLLRPLEDDEIDSLYEYLTGELAVCLNSHGHSVSETPSRESFRAGTKSGTLQWSPYDDVVTATYDEWMELNQACPQRPSELRRPDN